MLYFSSVKIRTKLFALVLLVVAGALLETAISIRTCDEIVSLRTAIDRGVRLIALARKTNTYTTDLVFDLFSPRLYSSLQGVILGPGGGTAKREWAASVAEFQAAYSAFIGDPLLRSLPADEELKTAFSVSNTLAERADREFKLLGADYDAIESRFSDKDELYGRIQLSKEESLYSVFDHVRSASFYLGNIFESYLERFVLVLESSAKEAQERALLLYLVVSAILTAATALGGTAVARSVLANVRIVDKAVERMSEGDFSSPVSPAGHDEVGELAHRVSLFSYRLKENVDSLSSLLGSVNSAIPGDPDLDHILEIVTASLVRHESLEAAAVCLIENDRPGRTAWAGFQPVASWELLSDACSLGSGPEKTKSFLLRDAEADPSQAESAGLVPGLRSCLAVPLVARTRVLGLCVLARRSRVFNDLELTQLESFADYTAQVVDNALANAALRARRDAEFRALQGQIQPHFIYNVLNGFSALNRMGEKKALESSLRALSGMMRYTLEHAPFATVGEEFDFLDRYCRLQKLRFDDRFTYSIEMDEAVADLPIPKLIVQPFLENAFIHGLEPVVKTCIIKVSAKAVEECLVIEVSDDGSGCDPRRIAEKKRVGIGNARERLALIYPAGTLTLSGARGSGFKVRISIPLRDCLGGIAAQLANQTTANAQAKPISRIEGAAS